MTFLKRLRMLKATWTQSWHEHRCGCGTTWFCSTTLCSPALDANTPCVDVCDACQQQHAQAWAEAIERRYGIKVNG